MEQEYISQNLRRKEEQIKNIYEKFNEPIVSAVMKSKRLQ